MRARRAEIYIYFNKRLYDLLIGLPYEYVSKTGDLNDRLKVVYNNSNLAPKRVLVMGKVGTPRPS